MSTDSRLAVSRPGRPVVNVRTATTIYERVLLTEFFASYMEVALAFVPPERLDEYDAAMRGMYERFKEEHAIP